MKTPGTPIPYYAWAAYHPSGDLLHLTISRTRAQAIVMCRHTWPGNGRDWRQLYREGYRIRPIVIQAEAGS